MDLAGDLLADKEVVSSAMTRELDRAGKALDMALAGRQVGLLSGGDPGIYAMAPVVFELARSRGIAIGPEGLDVEVIPGVPAVAAAAALLGAPLSHDFACLSLSDRLTSWEVIETRLDLASQARPGVGPIQPQEQGAALAAWPGPGDHRPSPGALHPSGSSGPGRPGRPVQW